MEWNWHISIHWPNRYALTQARTLIRYAVRSPEVTVKFDYVLLYSGTRAKKQNKKYDKPLALGTGVPEQSQVKRFRPI